MYVHKIWNGISVCAWGMPFTRWDFSCTNVHRTWWSVWKRIYSNKQTNRNKFSQSTAWASSLRYFQVTKCFPQDVMHVLLEGVVPTEFTLFLNHALEKKYTSPSQSLIQKLKISTTATMNGRINRVQFKKRPFKGLKKLDRMLVKCGFFRFYGQYLLHPQFQ